MTGAARFRHKPTVVEAVRWTGDNETDVKELAGELFTASHPVQASGGLITGGVYDRLHETWIGVKTGQWVALGTKGELWPIDHEVFTETYDPAEALARHDADLSVDATAALLGFLPVPEAMALGSRWLAEIGEAVLGRLGVKPDGRPGVSFHHADLTRIAIAWGAPPEGSGCKCYRGPLTHEHDSDEEGDCLVCGCGRYQAPEPKEAG